MKPSVRQFVGVIPNTVELAAPIYEFGALQVEGQEYLSDLRGFFPGKKYVGCDIRMGKGVDTVLNLHNIALPERIAGTVLILDTLEHVEYCRKALAEVHRILKEREVVIMSSVMNFPIHNYSHDYWRFTPEAFRSLLQEFSYQYVGFRGDERFPNTVVGIGMKDASPTLKEEAALRKSIADWKVEQDRADKRMNRKKRIKNSIKSIASSFLLKTFRELKGRNGK